MSYFHEIFSFCGVSHRGSKIRLSPRWKTNLDIQSSWNSRPSSLIAKGTVIVLRCIPSSTSFFSFLLWLDLQPYQTAAINKTVPLKDIQGRFINPEQFRIFQFRHIYSCSPRRNARLYGSWCAEKVKLRKSYNSAWLKG
jgi:hypothetical protein